MALLGNRFTEPDADVRKFAIWWLRHKVFAAPQDGIRQIGNVWGVTLYRSGPFQVQLFLAAPHSSAPRHHHPNIDSVEYYVSGKIDFYSDKQAIIPGTKGALLHIDHTDTHVAVAGHTGGCFISIQKWLNGVRPSSVELDWAGNPVDDKHAHQIKTATNTDKYRHGGRPYAILGAPPAGGSDG